MAGVNLNAQGFRNYIRQLQRIDRLQQSIFNRRLRGTTQSIEALTRAQNKYTQALNRTTEAERRAARAALARGNAVRRSQAQQGGGASAGTGIGAAGLVAGAGPVGLAIGTAFALNKAAQESIELSRTQASAEAQLAAAIKSTGAAARLTASELKSQASALQDVTNFGDETTIVAQAQLLTFTKIGREVFPRATKAVLDLATRMGGDLRGAVVQIGKALNDPVSALGALSRAGIQFDEQQKQQIKTLVEANNILGAQNIILAELEKQFGGSAEAARKADGGNIALKNSFGDLLEEVGDIFRAFSATFNISENGIKIIGFLTRAIQKFQTVIAFAGAGVAAFGTIIAQTFEQLRIAIANIGRFFRGEATQSIKTSSQVLDEAGISAINKFNELQAIFEGTFDEGVVQNAIDLGEGIEDAAESADSFVRAIQQAENLFLSFARQAEDAARKLARQIEDVERKQTRQINKLREKQAKDRLKLLQRQQERLDDFEKDRLKQIKNTEAGIAKEQQRANDERVRSQRRLQDRLKQQADRFRLSQIQGERRFQLAEKRLRAEGDILALQQLREDRELQVKEAQENFALQQKETKDNAKSQERIATEDLTQRLKDLKGGLEDQRAELLQSFDKQLEELQVSQTEQTIELQRNFAEQAEDRAIALAREEEDRRISQARQLEDLGRSLARQKDVTEEGVIAIANEIAKVFGNEGVADQIIKGFSKRTESDFTELFENIEEIASKTQVKIPIPEIIKPVPGTPATRAHRIPRPIRHPDFTPIPADRGFDQGGIVPGPIGSPQHILAHGGETVLPTHRANFPSIPSQNLNVLMSGGFNISGADNATAGSVDAAINEMTNIMEIAIKRVARRN